MDAVDIHSYAEGEHNELIIPEKKPQEITIQINELPNEPVPIIKEAIEPLTVVSISKCQLPTLGELTHRINVYFRSKIHDQDTIQKITVLMIVCMEFYRILMGSLLLSFVPQKCGDHVCGITENLYSGGSYFIIYILNLMTLISFSLLYLVEIKRENRLITYLDVNNNKPTDAISVAIHLRTLPDIKREKILYIDKVYQQIGCCAISIYVFNTVLSAIVIYANYLDNKTITAYLTNVLFMGCKVSEVYTIANTENNIFFSAYLKNKVQYNDVDNDKINDGDFGQSSEGSREEY
jgi:hypothetical protein